MSTLPRFRTVPPSPRKGIAVSAVTAAALATVASIVGLTTIWSSVVLLWVLWTTDPLKSIGMIVPLVSLVLILRVWRSLDWEMHGTWYGLVLLVATALLVRIRNQSVIEIILAPQWTIFFPPHAVVVFAYAAGVVLLFGGVRLFRAALFPLLLLLLVNPVPHLFNVYVDLPLQRVSAHVARGFAMALGQPLSPDKLRLMFTPEFGMFIAPGCNGIRGAVTMGLIALVAGYLYRFRWRAHLGVVVAAIALGYVFNFLRLCVLVLFYLVALRFPGLQDSAENADYLIGAVLFFFAVYLLYTAIQRLGRRSGGQAATLDLPHRPDLHPEPMGHVVPRLAAMTLLALFGLVGLLTSLRGQRPSAELASQENALGQFPGNVGSYTLVRSWNEKLITGALLFHWAEYAPAGGGTHIALGVSPFLGSHDTLVCHSARGEDPLWHGQESFPTALTPVDFSASFFNDGATQFLEATTLCNGTSCGEYGSSRTHFGIVYSRPHPESLLAQNPDRPIPILLRAETVDTTLPILAARTQLAGDMRNFVQSLNLDTLTSPYRRP